MADFVVPVSTIDVLPDCCEMVSLAAGECLTDDVDFAAFVAKTIAAGKVATFHVQVKMATYGDA